MLYLPIAPFIYSCNYTCSSFANILSSNWFGGQNIYPPFTNILPHQNFTMHGNFIIALCTHPMAGFMHSQWWKILYSWLWLSYNCSYIFCSLQVFYGLCEPICKLKYSGIGCNGNIINSKWACIYTQNMLTCYRIYPYRSLGVYFL